MATFLVIFQLFIVLALIFIGARVGGIGLGIYGMVGVFILVFIFGMHPGKVPIDVMLIIASVITATAALQAAGGLDYLVGLAAKFLRKHPTHITYYGPLTTWLFCLVAGTAHTSYSLLPIISEIAKNSKIRPERPMTVATIAASLGITGSPMSAATAAVISTDLLGGQGIDNTEDAGRHRADDEQNESKLQNLVVLHLFSSFAMTACAFLSIRSPLVTPKGWRRKALSIAQVQRFMIRMA